jgi:hypothetical protein
MVVPLIVTVWLMVSKLVSIPGTMAGTFVRVCILAVDQRQFWTDSNLIVVVLQQKSRVGLHSPAAHDHINN